MDAYQEPDDIKPVNSDARTPGLTRPRTIDGPAFAKGISMERVTSVVSSMFVLGRSQSHPVKQRRASTNSQPHSSQLPYLSPQATVGRNSQFRNLTVQDREVLGGIEYRSLKPLLKIVLGKQAALSLTPRTENPNDFWNSLLFRASHFRCHLPCGLDSKWAPEVA